MTEEEAAEEKLQCRCLGIQAILPLTLEPLAVTEGLGGGFLPHLPFLWVCSIHITGSL